MTQDVPLEASETLAFTPDCLKDVDGAPSFLLRAATSREDRFLRRLYREEGLVRHDIVSIRAEILEGLAALWTPEAFAEHSPQLTEYWEASDQHVMQVAALRKENPDLPDDDPSLAFEFDADLEKAIGELVGRVTESWPPLRRMFANNAEFGEMSMVVLAATMVKGWTGLDVKLDLDRGHVTIACAEAISEALGKFERRRGMAEGLAWAQLTIECGRRMRLDEDEVGNSASPSPSSESQEPSNTAKPLAKAGKSRASASSAKTPETA